MNQIDYSRLRTLAARKLVAALKRDGFFLERQSSGHRQYYHQDGRRVTLSFHRGSDTLPIKTLRSIIERQARWNQDDLRRLKLIS